MITASFSFSFDGDGASFLILHMSGGGNNIGFPSNFKTCRLLISPRQRGSLSILFLCIAKTFNEVRFDISAGNVLILFLLTSKISREDSCRT